MSVLLPTPKPDVIYCVQAIRSYPERSYAYLTIFDGREEKVLFYRYPTTEYWQFIEDLKALCPLHCVVIMKGLVTFAREASCPCDRG